MLYLFLGLKIPILMLGGIVWWAVRQTPEPIEPDGGDGGGRRVRPHEPPKLPRAPRRGPHGERAPLPPPRVRKVTARARELDR